jgi:anti-sigma factor RsiW
LFTNCVSPPELDDKQLFAYLDNKEANPETALHLTKCPYCRERAEALERLQKRLTKRLYRVACPSPMELGEYHLHLLPASQMLVVRQHLNECPHCSQEVAELDEFLNTQEAGVLGKAKGILARLLGESAETRLPGGLEALRGEAKGPMTFEADGVLITLDVQAGAAGRASLVGQVAADDQDQWTGSIVRLQQSGIPQATVLLDDLGAFRYEDAHPGSIELTITSPYGVEVQIPSINIDL